MAARGMMNFITVPLLLGRGSREDYAGRVVSYDVIYEAGPPGHPTNNNTGRATTTPTAVLVVGDTLHNTAL